MSELPPEFPLATAAVAPLRKRRKREAAVISVPCGPVRTRASAVNWERRRLRAG
jgi:hypothetical protein